jgi:hypothetical protein
VASLGQSRATGNGGRLFAALLCVLALAVNLLGAVAYAGSVQKASAGGLGFIDASICHSGPEVPAGQTAEPRLKCPLCQISSAGYQAPASMPATVAVVPSDVIVPALPQADNRLPSLPLTVRPEPRGPPAFV